MLKQSLTSSNEQSNMEPDSEKKLLWKNSYPAAFVAEHDVVWKGISC